MKKQKTKFLLNAKQLIGCLLEAYSDRDVGDIEYYSQRIIDQMGELEHRLADANDIIESVIGEVEDRQPFSFEFEFIEKCERFINDTTTEEQ